MNELPQHIGGLQHLADDVTVKADDVLVSDGKPVDFCHEWAGETVAQVESGELCRVYRRIPVAKQGDIDHTGVPATPEQLDVPRDQKPGVVAFRALGCSALPTDAKARKGIPIYSGFLKYFPRACAAVAELSRIGNDQHNPGKPLHWDRSKSGDEHDAMLRHILEAGKIDTDGVRHSTKAAWRGMAALEKELEAAE